MNDGSLTSAIGSTVCWRTKSAIKAPSLSAGIALYDRATSISRVYKEQPVLGIGTSSLRGGECSMLSTPSSPSVGGSSSTEGVPPAAKMSWTTFESPPREDKRG